MWICLEQYVSTNFNYHEVSGEINKNNKSTNFQKKTDEQYVNLFTKGS